MKFSHQEIPESQGFPDIYRILQNFMIYTQISTFENNFCKNLSIFHENPKFFVIFGKIPKNSAIEISANPKKCAQNFDFQGHVDKNQATYGQKRNWTKVLYKEPASKSSGSGGGVKTFFIKNGFRRRTSPRVCVLQRQTFGGPVTYPLYVSSTSRKIFKLV